MRLLAFQLNFTMVIKLTSLHIIFVCLNVCLDASFGSATVWHYEARRAARSLTAQCTVAKFDEFWPKIMRLFWLVNQRKSNITLTFLIRVELNDKDDKANRRIIWANLFFAKNSISFLADYCHSFHILSFLPDYCHSCCLV